jgi:pimeloyl-ACP methyl ester carboxylesterase
VVLEAGAGAFGLDYYTLFELCAQRTTCVLYDRAGSGWSDPVDGPCSAAEIVTDLHNALGLAGVNGPYLLVGHSLGGLLVRVRPALPDDVVGSSSSTFTEHPLPKGDETIVKQCSAIAGQPGPLAPVVAVSGFEKLRSAGPADLNGDRDEAGLDMINAAPIQAEVTNGPALPDIPVTILTGMKIDPTPGRSSSDMEAFNKIKRDAHRAFINSVPHGEHRVLEDAGHRLTAERPDLVVNAIFDILDRVASR